MMPEDLGTELTVAPGSRWNSKHEVLLLCRLCPSSYSAAAIVNRPVFAEVIEEDLATVGA